MARPMSAHIKEDDCSIVASSKDLQKYAFAFSLAFFQRFWTGSWLRMTVTSLTHKSFDWMLNYNQDAVSIAKNAHVAFQLRHGLDRQRPNTFLTLTMSRIPKPLKA